MATKKTTTKKAKKANVALSDFSETPTQSTDSCACCKVKGNKTTKIVILLAFILLFALALSKGYILVAIVNNKPIFRMQLDQAMMSRFGKQTLEGMISEELIAKEAGRLGVTITQEEINKQEDEVLKSFGGKVNLDELLKFQGTTKAEFDSQIKLQLLVNRMMEKDVTVTDEEIATYKETNKAIMVSSDEADLTEEARKTLIEQKVNEKIQPWFTELKNKAKIFKFF